jgi:hypothetical protein
MHFLLPKIIIAALVFTLWNIMPATGSLTPARVDRPFAVVSNNSLNAQNSIPSGWRKVDANGKFNFYLPPSMWDTGASGIEEFHKEFTNGRIHLSFDYEPMGILAYSKRTVAFGKNFEETELQVDGKKSYLFVYQGLDRKKRRTYNADFYVGDLPNGHSILHMWVTTWSPKNVETAKQIFQTIDFP